MYKQKYTLDESVFICLKNGQWWTFWDLQKVIKDNTDNYFGEPSISASIRNMRKNDRREKFGLKKYGEVIQRRRIGNGSKGYEYKLIIGEKNGR